MGFLGMDSGRAKLLDCLEIMLEHVRMLIILGGNVLLDSLGEVNGVGATEGDEEDIARRSKYAMEQKQRAIRTTPYWSAWSVKVQQLLRKDVTGRSWAAG